MINIKIAIIILSLSYSSFCQVNFQDNLAAMQAPINAKYTFVIWGDSHPFLSFYQNLTANLAPTGTIYQSWMNWQSNPVGCDFNLFTTMGVNLPTEMVYTGFISYQQTLPDYNLNYATKYIAFIAARPKARRLLEREKATLKKMHILLHEDDEEEDENLEGVHTGKKHDDSYYQTE